MSAKQSAEWIALAATSEIQEGQSKSFKLSPAQGEQTIAIFHHQGEWYALDDCCSHARIPISDGPLKDGCLMCPWHYAEFDLKTGAALSGPATEPIKTYPLRLTETGMIEIEITGVL